MKTYLFDLDDTLLDSVWIWEKMFDTFFEQEGVDVRFQRDVGQYFRKMSTPEIAQYIHDHILPQYSQEQLYREIRKRIAHLYVTQVSMKKGARRFLEQCGEKGIRMAVVTSGDLDIAEQTLEHFQIRSFFASVYSSGHLNLSKRNPQLLEYVMKDLHTSPKEVIYFEDSMYAIEAARKLGIRCIGLVNEDNREAFMINHVERIEDFDRLETI